MPVKRTLASLMTAIVVLAGCAQTGEPARGEQITDAEIKEKVSRAAGMSGQTYRALLTTGDDVRRIWEQTPSKSMTLVVLLQQAHVRSADSDFGVSSDTAPHEFAEALAGGNMPMKRIEYASFIRPPYITDLDWRRQSADTITGSLKVAVEGLYTGRASFTMTRAASDTESWRVTRLAIPDAPATSEPETVFTRNEQGHWRSSPAYFTPELGR